MGRWRESFTTMTPTEAFKMYFLFAGAFNIFGTFGCFHVIFKDKEYTKSKWLGTLVGVILNSVVIAVTCVFGRVLKITPLAIIFFVCYYIFLIAFWIFSFVIKLEHTKKLSKTQMLTNEKIKQLNREYLLNFSLSMASDIFATYNMRDDFVTKGGEICFDIEEWFNENEVQHPDLFLTNTDSREVVLKKVISIIYCHLLSLQEDFTNLDKRKLWNSIDTIIQKEKEKELSVFDYDSIIPIKNYFRKQIRELTN